MEKRITDTLKKHRVDIIVIAAILITALLSFLIFTLTRRSGAYATVSVKGEVVAEYPLDVNGTFPLNDGTNILVIEDGVAYFNHSDCPDHRCEKTGKVRFVGERIICLPNKVIVTITGESEGSVDLVS